VVVERWLLVDESGLLGGSYWSEAVVAYGFEEGDFPEPFSPAKKTMRELIAI